MEANKTIKINNKDYEIDSLSDAAKGQLSNIRMVEFEMQRLRRKLAIARTAHSAYIKALTFNLEEMEGSKKAE